MSIMIIQKQKDKSPEKVVPLSTAAVNFSCVPLLRAARAAVSLDWLGSSMATSSSLSILVLDLCLLYHQVIF